MKGARRGERIRKSVREKRVFLYTIGADCNSHCDKAGEAAETCCVCRWIDWGERAIFEATTVRLSIFMTMLYRLLY